MFKPIIYKAFPRFLTGLVAALLWNRYVNKTEFFNVKSYAFPVFGFIYIGLAWFSFLSIDGMKLKPNSAKKKKENEEKKINYADMSDYVDTEVSYDDLSDNEKSACKLAANLLCSAIFFILSIF